MHAGSPPWLMWGSTLQMSVVNPAGATTRAQASGQIARVDYARPERWCFFFGARIVNAVSAAATVTVNVNFDVNMGIGRTTLPVTSFNQFNWTSYATGGAGSSLLWCTEVVSPPKGFSDANVYRTRDFVAQSINAVVRADVTASANVLAQVDLEVTAMFSPAVHIRPEWFKHGQFNGGENGGT